MGIDLGVVGLATPRDIAQLQTRLRQQGVQADVQGMPYIEVFAFLTQVHRPQAHGEQRPAQLLQNCAHGFARR
ncbi:hypothetical protein D9M71_552350 [compost metagenome]